jgi:hypothetical protein
VDVNQVFVHFDFQLYGSIKVPIADVETSFTSQAQADKFKKDAINTLYETISLHLFTKRMNILLNGEIEKKDAAGNTVKEAINFDSTVKIGDFNDDAKVKSGLRVMRNHMAKYRTPSLDHTIFTKDADNKKFYSSWEMNEFVII